MLAKDLRIDNWVLCKGEDIDTEKPFEMECQVQSLPNGLEADYKIGVEFPSEECEVKGIPLTEEWLEKLGYQFSEHDKRWYAIPVPAFANLVIYRRGKYFGLAHTKTAEFEYVHQLQNLYFALIGEELKVKQLENA